MRVLGLLGLVVVSLTSLVPVSVWAQTVKSIDYSIHEEYISTRAMGMGNAFTAVADDFSAIFYNPANLAWREDGHLRMFIRAGASPEALKLFNEINDVKKESSDDQIQGYSDLIARHYGDHFYYRVPTIGMVWARPGWGIALIPADLSLDASVHRDAGPTLNVNMYEDTTLAVSYAHALHWLPKTHGLAWGMTAKSIHRIYVGQALLAAQLANGGSVWNTSQADEGLTFDADMSLSWKPPGANSGNFKYIAPSFALVGRNLVDYGFKQNFHFLNKNSGEPPKLQRRLDLGSKWELPKFWVFDPHVAFDIRDIGYDQWSLKKGYHAGAEFYWKMFNWWKGYWSAGVNQGYFTAGFGARMAFFNMDLATYGEEVGTDKSPQQSRRYMAELALDF
jgi:hypothetical protein